MYFKIQPEQIQLHNFSSPSGDLSFFAGSNYVYSNLSRFLTGEFDISGSISINGVKIPATDPSNFSSGDNSFCFGGLNNYVVGVRNTSFNGNSCSVLGTGNSCFNSHLANFPASSEKNTILGGRSASIPPNVTGAVFLKDQSATAVSSNGNNSLTLSFEGGIFVENGRFVIKSSDFHVGPLGSGLFSGDLHVLGETYKNGLKIATTGDLYAASGVLSSRISDTGASLSARINDSGSLFIAASGLLDGKIVNSDSELSARIDGVSGNAVFKTGSQTISGEKTFHQNSIFSQSLYIKGNSGILSGVSSTTQIVPATFDSSLGERGLFSYSGEFLYYKISDNPHLWVRHSGQLNWP